MTTRIHPAVMADPAHAAALALRLAHDDLETLGWCRPVGDDLQLGLLDWEMSAAWRGVHDEIAPAALTLVGALHRATALDVDSWADLARAEWRPLWDALVLGLATHTGIWDAPRTGLQAVESLARWERSVATHEDMLAVLLRAAEYAQDRRTTVECPACGCDPRPGETFRGETCPTCDGLAVIQLHPARWQLRLVRRAAEST